MYPEAEDLTLSQPSALLPSCHVSWSFQGMSHNLVPFFKVNLLASE